MAKTKSTKIIIRNVSGVLAIGYIEEGASLACEGQFNYYTDPELKRRATIVPSTLAIIVEEATNAEFDVHKTRFELTQKGARVDIQQAEMMINEKSRQLDEVIASQKAENPVNLEKMITNGIS